MLLRGNHLRLNETFRILIRSVVNVFGIYLRICSRCFIKNIYSLFFLYRKLSLWRSTQWRVSVHCRSCLDFTSMAWMEYSWRFSTHPCGTYSPHKNSNSWASRQRGHFSFMASLRASSSSLVPSLFRWKLFYPFVVSSIYSGRICGSLVQVSFRILL